jgi:hypothetical protein
VRVSGVGRVSALGLSVGAVRDSVRPVLGSEPVEGRASVLAGAVLGSAWEGAVRLSGVLRVSVRLGAVRVSVVARVSVLAGDSFRGTFLPVVAVLVDVAGCPVSLGASCPLEGVAAVRPPASGLATARV